VPRAYADTASDQRAALQAQLDLINTEIKQNQTTLSGLQSERTSLERDVAILDSKIQAAQLGIKQLNLVLAGLKSDIKSKENGILSLDSKLADGEVSLAQILRSTQEIDDRSIAEVILGGSLSDGFNDIDAYQTVQQALGRSFDTMTTQRSDLAARKSALEEQQQEQQDILQIQVLQQNQLKKSEQQKQDLVSAARGQESIYEQIIAGKQKSAAQIEAALFALRDTSAVSFGKMYSYAKDASAKTGVPSAFILAILSQESDLGQNIGSCLVTSLQTGDGVGKNSGDTYQKVMKAPRDTAPFQRITQQFSMPWSGTPVSCPLGRTYTASRGYGGAMGPAQFIPSTWELYADRIAAATGQSQSNPWDPRTATFAVAIYMSDLGADRGTATAERNAALKYFAGSHWQNPAYGFYGTQVMSKVADFEQQIQILGG
jgi:membrane-bound lytic murein transglycosylase B